MYQLYQYFDFQMLSVNLSTTHRQAWGEWSSQTSLKSLDMYARWHPKPRLVLF